MKNPFENGRSLLKKHKTALLVGLFIALGLLSAWTSAPVTLPVSSPEPPPEDVSTFIPRGHLLIPIELKNADQLDGLLGSHGFVDLFEDPVTPGARSKLVGRRLRLLRAPLNPKAFAVLVRDDEAEKFLSYRGRLIASVRPPESGPSELSPTKKGPVIEFQKEGSP